MSHIRCPWVSSAWLLLATVGVLPWEPTLHDSRPCSFWEHWLPVGQHVPSLGLHFSAGKSSSLLRDSVRMTTSWVLKTTEIDCLTVLDRNLRSRHQQGHAPSAVLAKNLHHASLQASGSFSPFLGL